MSFVETLLAAILIFAALNCILLSREYLSASGTRHFNLSILIADDPISPLPGTTTLATTEVMILDSTGGLLEGFIAPVTGH